MFRVRSILYPTDFSSYSNQAYLHAVSMAEAVHAALTIMHVATPDEAANSQFWQEQLNQIKPGSPAIKLKHVFVVGDPATEIVRYALEHPIDRIVMGTHGRTGVERLLMGSVAERVLRDAPCSVLVVKLPRGHTHNPDSAQIPIVSSPSSSNPTEEQ
jgi:nucleotide-binding universal stress UspA family protein